MKDYNCRKCGNIDLFIKINGTQVGLYCSDCGAWQKWLSKDEQRLVEQWIEHVKSEKKQMITESKIGLPVIHNTGLPMREERNPSDDSPPWEDTPNPIVKSVNYLNDRELLRKLELLGYNITGYYFTDKQNKSGLVKDQLTEVLEARIKYLNLDIEALIGYIKKNY